MSVLNTSLNEKEIDSIYEYQNGDTLSLKNPGRGVRLSRKERTMKKIELRLNRFLHGIRDYTDLKIIDPYLKTNPVILNDIPSMTPLEQKVYITSSKYGMRTHPITKKKKAHLGYDLAAAMGSKVYATADGRVQLTKISNAGYGNYIEIKHRFGFETRYGHLSKILVVDNQYVKQGDLIGLVGSTGLSTGPHLHYEIIKNGSTIDPFVSFDIKYNYYKIAFENKKKKSISNVATKQK